MNFQKFVLIVAIYGSWIIMSDTAPSSNQRPGLIKTGRSRIRYTDPGSMRKMKSSIPPLPILDARSIAITLPVTQRHHDVRSLFGCDEDKERCFFGLFGGGEDDSRGYNNYNGPLTQGRPSIFTPTPIIGVPPPYMDYYEVCDEIYDPYNDEYLEDCTSYPDYYYRH